MHYTLDRELANKMNFRFDCDAVFHSSNHFFVILQIDQLSPGESCILAGRARLILSRWSQLSAVMLQWYHRPYLTMSSNHFQPHVAPTVCVHVRLHAVLAHEPSSPVSNAHRVTTASQPPNLSCASCPHFPFSPVALSARSRVCV